MNKQIKEFLRHSNYIENERSEIALQDSIKAWEYAYRNRHKITVDYILEIHRLLARRLRPDIAGKIRTCDVWIGGHKKHFISEALIKADLQMSVCFEMIAKGMLDKEEKARQVHIRFEQIHPFEDFNGRTGRILWQVHRLRLGLPIEIIHEGDEQKNYYSWFRN